MKQAVLVLVCALSSSVLVGCSEQPKSVEGWKPVPVARLDAGQEEQLALADRAKTAMFGELMSTLMGELGKGGPAGAIHVCKEEAPRIAAETSKQLGVKIGRTSWKLRNPQNSAPAWAVELLADRPTEPRATAGPDGALGVMLPIKVSAPCLSCHGPADAISDAVREALSKDYPEDEATGFASGDLRGWFWIEVPASK